MVNSKNVRFLPVDPRQAHCKNVEQGTLTHHQENVNPQSNVSASSNMSAQDIASMTELMSHALESLEMRGVPEHTKTAEEYQALLKKKEELMDLYNGVSQKLSFTQQRREGESQARTLETVDVLGTGYTKLLRGIESVLARVIVWIEEYEHDNGINTGVSEIQSARKA
ncbi:hypothetical protein BDP55DRAFT_638767 [Colletotrichum godetiae]|uniref:Uncharacterized protein n=1 Tax=Colletotrichum godetiae TaxID=1209918 RepID=A0AAJ0ELE1_9PEZI|nr:uncharacterized protein BDP55DRAFT_638767 [Colletotrichum godetiae]KAK1657435.1 hypothetical protein BDP55DRAFT_638767 [Colletotrichum godetiae]